MNYTDVLLRPCDLDIFPYQLYIASVSGTAYTAPHFFSISPLLLVRLKGSLDLNENAIQHHSLNPSYE